MPAKNKKHTDPNKLPAGTRPQSRTLHNTAGTHTLSKKGGFKFRWWYAAILILLVAVIGIAVLRFSHASSANTMNCDQYPSACVGNIDVGNPTYTAYQHVLSVTSGSWGVMQEPASNIFGPNNGTRESTFINVCWTLEATDWSIPSGGIEYKLYIQTDDGIITPITDRVYAPATYNKCANNVWLVEPSNNSSKISYGLTVTSGNSQMWVAQVVRTTNSVTGGTIPPAPPPPVPVVTKPNFGASEKTAMTTAIRMGGSLQPIEATCNNYGNKAECESYFKEAIKPIGNVESFDCKAESTLNGWAADPTSMNRSIEVHMYIDTTPEQGGSGIPGIIANKPRPDTGGNHGFNAVMPAQYLNGQTHTAHVYGLGNYGNKQIGQYQFKCEQPPIGNVESLVSNNTFNATINGWTLDKSNPNTSIQVHVYYDGNKDGAVFVADKPRPDVNTAFGVGGNHGFNIPLNPKYLDGKQHSIYVYAIGINPNGSPSGYNTNLTEQKFGLFSIDATPRGTVDSLNCRADNNNVATGWAFDPNDSSRSIDVDMYIDGKGAGRFKADKSRPDVNAAYRITGNHGFSIPIPQTAQDGKQHTIQIYAIGVGVNSPSTLPQFNPLISPRLNTSFACNRLPEGNLEDTVYTPAPNYQCIARGWAYDPSAPDLADQIAVYIDFNSDFTKWANLETIVAKNARGDLVAAKKGNGNHGFVYAIPSKFYDGKPHSIYAYALNIDNAGKYLAYENRFIGNKTFTCPPKPTNTVTTNATADTKTTNTQTQSSVTDATDKNDNKKVTVINTKAPINYDSVKAADDLKSATKDSKKTGSPQVIPISIPPATNLATNDSENKDTATGVVYIHPSLPKDSGVNQTAVYIDGKNPTIYKSDDVTQELDTRLMTNGEHKVQTLAYANDNNVYAVEQTIKVDNKNVNPVTKLWLQFINFLRGSKS